MSVKKGEHVSIDSEFKIGHIPWNKGLTKETDEKLRKMSEQNVSTRFKKGEHPLTEWEIGQTPWNKGLTKETDKRVKDSPTQFKRGDKRVTRENNPAWKGGITSLRERIRSSFEYRQWRSDVYTRDDFTCQKCGKRGVRLHAHHIKSFALIFMLNDITTFEQALECSELWDINNGITYCKKCHFDEREN